MYALQWGRAGRRRDARHGLDAEPLPGPAPGGAVADVFPARGQAGPVEVLFVQHDRADQPGVGVDADAEHQPAGHRLFGNDAHGQRTGHFAAVGRSVAEGRVFAENRTRQIWPLRRLDRPLRRLARPHRRLAVLRVGLDRRGLGALDATAGLPGRIAATGGPAAGATRRRLPGGVGRAGRRTARIVPRRRRTARIGACGRRRRPLAVRLRGRIDPPRVGRVLRQDQLVARPGLPVLLFLLRFGGGVTQFPERLPERIAPITLRRTPPGVAVAGGRVLRQRSAAGHVVVGGQVLRSGLASEGC